MATVDDNPAAVEVGDPPVPEPPEATLDIRVGNDIHPAILPRAPLRFMLNNAVQEAFGLTKFDREQLRDMDPSEPFTPSGQPDPYALQCAFYAIVGVCWGGPKLPVPPLRSMRHDVVAYGEAVYEHFLLTLQDLEVAKHLIREGRKLRGLMMAEITERLSDEIEVEKDFSVAQGAASTSA